MSHASEHLHDALIQAFHKLSICICTVQSILHVTSTTRMHDKVAPKQAQVACIRKNTSKHLCSTARWTLHNHTEQNLQRNYLVNLSVRVADSRLVHCSAGIWERAGFALYLTMHKFTYFSLAWLSDGTTAPFPLAYMVDSVWRLLTYSTPVKGSGQENGLSP